MNIDEFISATIVVAYSVFETNITHICDTVLKISFELILKKTMNDKIDYQKLITNLHPTKLNQNITLFEKEVEKVFNLKLPHVILPNYPIIWPTTFGPYVWIWIHVVTHYIDLNGGLNEKKTLYFICRVIVIM